MFQIYKVDDATDEWVPVGNAEQVLDPDSTLVTNNSDSEEEPPTVSAKKRKVYQYPKRTRPESKEEKSVSQSLKDIQSHLHVLMSHNDDYHDSFGKYIASLLRSLPPQKALALQPRIVSLITEVGASSDGDNLQTAECQSTYL